MNIALWSKNAIKCRRVLLFPHNTLTLYTRDGECKKISAFFVVFLAEDVCDPVRHQILCAFFRLRDERGTKNVTCDSRGSTKLILFHPPRYILGGKINIVWRCGLRILEKVPLLTLEKSLIFYLSSTHRFEPFYSYKKHFKTVPWIIPHVTWNFEEDALFIKLQGHYIKRGFCL